MRSKIKMVLKRKFEEILTLTNLTGSRSPDDFSTKQTSLMRRQQRDAEVITVFY